MLTQRDEDNKKEIKRLLARIDDNEQRMLELECTQLELKTEFDATNKKNEDEITRLGKVIADLEYIITSKNQDISALVERNQQIREEMAKTDREANVIKSKANTRIKELEEMRTALNIEKQRTSMMEKSKSSIVRNVRERSINMAAEKDLRYDQVIQELEKKNSELTGKYQTALEDKNELRRQFRHLQLESTKKRDEHERTHTELSKNLRKAESERDTAVAKHKELEEKYRLLHSGYRQLEYNMGLLETKISERDLIKDKTTSLIESMESSLSTPVYTPQTPAAQQQQQQQQQPQQGSTRKQPTLSSNTTTAPRNNKPVTNKRAAPATEENNNKVTSKPNASGNVKPPPRVASLVKPTPKKDLGGNGIKATNSRTPTASQTPRNGSAATQAGEATKPPTTVTRPSNRSPIKAPPKPRNNEFDLDDTLIIDVESVDIGELLDH